MRKDGSRARLVLSVDLIGQGSRLKSMRLTFAPTDCPLVTGR